MGAFSGSATTRPSVDDATLEYSGNTLREKDGGTTKAKLADGAIARCIVSFIIDTGSTSVSSATDYFTFLSGTCRSALPSTTTTEAYTQIEDYDMVVREIHVVSIQALTRIRVLDDGATGDMQVETISANTPKATKNLSTTIAKGSNVCLGFVAAGATTVQASGFLVVDLFP